MLPILSAVVFVSAASAYSFMRDEAGNALSWAEPDAFLYLNPSNDQGIPEDEVQDAFIAAVAAWNGSGADIRLHDEGNHDLAESAVDQVNLIWFDSAWPQDPTLVAKASVYAQNATIVAADIALNTADFSFTTGEDADRMDLQSVLTHELGHLLGLDHSEDAEATMFATTELGETSKRSLRPDDQNGLQKLYPEPGTVACNSGAVGSRGLAGVLLGLLALVSRRKR